MNATPKSNETKSDVVRIPMLLGGEWVHSDEQYEDRDPYRGDLVALVPISRTAHLDQALNAAKAAKKQIAAMPGFERAALLRRVAVLIEERAGELGAILARETGKALSDSEQEVRRSVDTITLSAEEAVRITGEHVPLDSAAAGAGKIAIMLRFPVGVVAAITPFNAPFNLACHKIGPAIAAGNAIVLKAPPQAPLIVHKLAELFVEAGVPAGVLSILYGDEIGQELVRDPRVDFITFTGSTRVGAAIRAAAGLKRVALELGGIGPTIIHNDANLLEAAQQCARNSMRLSGQSCISVQNIYVHRDVYPAFLPLLVAEVAKMKLGDPLDKATSVGTVIDDTAATRIKASIDNALAHGARALIGGNRHGNQIEPTVLVDVDPAMRAVCEEVFGPVCSVQPYDDVEAVFAMISEHEFGLQAGIFTASLHLAMQAVKAIRTGGVILNGTSTFRTDQLAYGGVKNSGIGREGPHYAVKEMTEERLVVFNL